MPRGKKQTTLRTFEHQLALPHLPVPELRTTLKQYLRGLEPFLTRDELIKSAALVDEFGKPGGEGEELQAILLKRAAEHDNWLEEWWEYAAYLSDRTSNALFVNMFSGFGSFLEFGRPVSQARRAAETIRYTCEYLELLKQEKIPPETMAGNVLCMRMFKRIFSSCRIPQASVDYFERADVTIIRHIVVFCDGRIFVLQVFDAASNLLTIGDLEAQLLHILKYSAYLNALKVSGNEASKYTDGQFIGALTSMGRDEWARVREEMLAFDGYNQENLETIQTSLFAVCLDDRSPPTPSALVKECAAGSCGNRWYDKSFQYIVFRNGMVGANMEHANVDATVLQSMYRWLGERYLNRNGGYETYIESRHHTLEFLPPPELLKWKLPASIKAKIYQAIETFETKGKALRTLVIRNKKYGKANLKRVNIFPDIFIQMGIQLAAYQLWGHVVPTYESAHTRMFLHGRTETIRTVSTEVKEWLEAMQGNESDVNRYEKFTHAMRRHKQTSLAALSGQGIDRHLLGLQIAALLSGKKVPALFTDSAYIKSGGNGNFVLSTSNVSGYPWLWGGFVPMVPQGIGVCYGTENDFLAFILTSFDKSTHERPVAITTTDKRFTAEQFQRALFQALDVIYDLADKQQRTEQHSKI